MSTTPASASASASASAVRVRSHFAPLQLARRAAPLAPPAPALVAALRHAATTRPLPLALAASAASAADAVAADDARVAHLPRDALAFAVADNAADAQASPAAPLRLAAVLSGGQAPGCVWQERAQTRKQKTQNVKKKFAKTRSLTLTQRD